MRPGRRDPVGLDRVVVLDDKMHRHAVALDGPPTIAFTL